MKRLLIAFAFLASLAVAQPTPPATGSLTVNTTTGAITAPANVTAQVFASANGLVQTSAVIDGAHGGTGVANTGKTITLGGNVTTSGAFDFTATLTGNTTVTFPTTGTLSTLAGSETFTNKTINGATNTLSAIPGGALNASSVPNSSLANATVTISGHSLALGGTLSLAQADVSGLTTSSTPAFADVTIGVGGPSVSSSLNARAPRQGLVFDGTAATAKAVILSLGTSNWFIPLEFDVPASNPSVAPGLCLVGGATDGLGVAGTLAAFIQTTGTLYIYIYGATGNDWREATIANFVANYGGHRVTLGLSQASGTLTIYLNGTTVAYSERTFGSAPAWNNGLSGTSFFVGSTGVDNPFRGYIATTGPENRALSAAEVLALYESGVPAATDVAPYSFSNSNFYNYGAVPYSGFSGASATGFSATGGTGSASSSNLTNGVRTAEVYRVDYTLTLNSGSAPSVLIGNIGISSNSNSVAGSAGANTAYLTITSNAATAQVVFTNSAGAGDFTVSGVAIKKLGLLCYPDPQQLGAGLTWKDVSGNGADITLPASGVSWALPWSGVTPAVAHTVSSLPAAASCPGTVQYVTDANATTRLSTVAGGGTNKVMVFSDGTNWLIQ